MSTDPARRGRSRRAVAVLVDEVISSLQNYVVIFAALHALSVADIGRFTLAYTSITLVEIVLKALVLTSLNIHFAAADEGSQRRAGADAAGATILVGGAAGVLLGAFGLLLGSPGRAVCIATGAAAFALVAQESWRSYFFTIAKPWRAAGNDTACLLVTITLVWLAVAHGEANTPADLVLLLAAGTGVGFILGIAQTRIVPSLAGGISWLRAHSGMGIRVAGSRGAAQLAGRLSLWVLGAISGATALGRLGAARTLIAPATTLVTSMASYSLPEAARLHRRDDPRFRRFLVGNSVALAGLVLLIGLVLAVLPDSLGRLLAGANLGVARQLLLPVVLFAAANALQQGARIGMITLLRAGLSLRIAITTGVGLVLAAASGAWVDGAAGAAWGLAIVQGVQILTWWTAFARVASGRARRWLWFGRSRTA
jgi:O-antigen/teichoic acid export membrane protein